MVVVVVALGVLDALVDESLAPLLLDELEPLDEPRLSVL
ncbi:MAG: hypothetical protein RIS41_836 [Actinomycetota bacterium]